MSIYSVAPTFVKTETCNPGRRNGVLTFEITNASGCEYTLVFWRSRDAANFAVEPVARRVPAPGETAEWRFTVHTEGQLTRESP